MRATVLLSALAATLAAPAFAADLDGADVPPAERSLRLGLGVGFAPTYEGADDYRATAFPIIQPSFGSGPSRVDFRGLDDIRIAVLPASRFRFGPVIGYTFGRDESDDARLTGLGDVDGGLVLGGFVGYDLVAEEDLRFGVAVAYTQQVTGDVFQTATVPGLTDEFGAEIDFGASGGVRLSERLDLTARAGAVYATDDYMDALFGISAVQAANSALPAYDPGAGIKSAYVRADVNFDLTDRIQLRAGLGYSRLVGDAGDSPVVADRNQFDGQVGASYKFRF